MNEAVTLVVVHGAWADGSSWSDVIRPLQAKGFKVIAAPIPLTSLSDDVKALDRVVERTTGPVVLASHAYAGAVISASTNARVRSLVDRMIPVATQRYLARRMKARVRSEKLDHTPLVTAPNTVVEVILDAVSSQSSLQ